MFLLQKPAVPSRSRYGEGREHRWHAGRSCCEGWWLFSTDPSRGVEGRLDRASARGGVMRQPKISPHDFKGWLLKERVGFHLVTILKLKAFQEIPQNLVLAFAIVFVVRSAKKCTQLMFAHTKISQSQYRQYGIGL